MSGISFIKTFLIVFTIASLLVLLVSCKLNANKAQSSEKLPEADSSELSGSFTPSHTEGIDLIKREDGDFDTPVAISYQTPDGKTWKAPAGTITDGASIPTLFAGLFGGKKSEKHLFAAIIHDAYCARANEGGPAYQIESWQDTHRMFYHACISNGRSLTKAGTMYAAVRLGGPRWSLNGESFTDLSKVDQSILEEEMAYCQSWIESRGESLTLDEIDQWMEDRESILVARNKATDK